MCDRMSLHRPKVKVPSADSYSNSHVKVTKFRHIWTIENFSFLPTREVWLSPVFDAGTKDGVYWCAGIYPKNDYRPHSALFLYLVGQRKDDMLVNLEVSILTDEREIIMKRFSDEPTSVGRGFCWIDTKSVFPSSEPNASILPDDKFTLSIKISYAPSNNEILTQCSQAESALLKCEYPGLPDGQIDKRTNSQVVLAASGRDFRAHKAIFAARFPTLKAIFDESPDDEQIRHLEIEEFPEDCLEELERFIYTGETGDPDLLKKIVATIEKDVRNKSFVLLYRPPRNLKRVVSFGQLGEKVNALPVLTDALIEKFRKDSTAFYEWWNEYCDYIHVHENLSTNFKLSCLGDLVEGELKCADLPEEGREDIYFDRLANLFVRFGNIGATPIEMIRDSLRMHAPFMGKKLPTETRLAIDIRLGALDLGRSFCWTADSEADKRGSGRPTQSSTTQPRKLPSNSKESAASKSDGIDSLMSTYEVVYDS